MEKEDCFAKTCEISSERQNCFVVGGLKEMRLGEGSIFPFDQGTKSKLPKTHPTTLPAKKQKMSYSLPGFHRGSHALGVHADLFILIY